MTATHSTRKNEKAMFPTFDAFVADIMDTSDKRIRTYTKNDTLLRNNIQHTTHFSECICLYRSMNVLIRGGRIEIDGSLFSVHVL